MKRVPVEFQERVFIFAQRLFAWRAATRVPRAGRRARLHYATVALRAATHVPRAGRRAQLPDRGVALRQAKTIFVDI